MKGIEVNLMDKIIVSEYGNAVETIGIEVFQSASLVLQTKRLSEMVCEQINNEDRNCLARATVLMGAAALEALLIEVAYIEKPELYDKREFRKTGFEKKIEMLKGKEFLPLCHETDKLWKYRIALTHSEPINERTLKTGEIINAEGAQWVYKTLEEFVQIIWNSKIPSWFSETIEIRNQK